MSNTVTLNLAISGTERVNAEIDNIGNKFKSAFSGPNAGRINLSVTGADKAQTEIQRISGLVKSAFAASIGIGFANSLAKIADAAQNNAAKLRIVTKTTQEFAQAQADVLRISLLTGGAIGATTDLYSKLAISLGRLKASQAELATVTQSVSQALLVSGSTTAGTVGALTQLGQAFNSGVLRGQEFNSVAEQAPRLLQAIADQMQVPVQALRGLARQGEITSEVLFKALTGEGAAKIAAEAANIPITIGRAFTNLSSVIERYVGDADKATGASQAFVSVINGLANNIGLIAPILAAAGFAGFTLLVARSTAALVLQVAGLGAARAQALLVTQANLTLAVAENAAATSALNLARASLAAAAGAEAQAIATGNLAKAQLSAISAASALAASQIAAGAASAGMGARLLGLVGGPIGLAITGLSLAAAAYVAFGSSAEKSAEGTDTALDSLKKLNEERAKTPKFDPSNEAAIEIAVLEQRAKLQQEINKLQSDFAAEQQRIASSNGLEFALPTNAIDGDLKRLRGSIDDIDKSLATLAITQDDFRGRALIAFREAAQNGFSFEFAVRKIIQAVDDLIGRTNSNDITGKLGDIAKAIARDLESSQEALQRAQGKNPLLEQLNALVISSGLLDEKSLALIATLRGQAEQTDANAAATDRLKSSQQGARQAQEDQNQAVREAAEALEQLNDFTADLAARFNGTAKQAAEKYSDALRRIAKAKADLSKDGLSSADNTALFNAETAAANDYKASLDEIAQAEAQRRAGSEAARAAIFAGIDREIALIGLLEEERQRLIDSFEAEDDARRFQQSQIQNGFPFSEQERLNLQDKIELLKAIARELREEAALKQARGQFGAYDFGGGRGPETLNEFPQLLGAALDASFKRGADGFKAVLESFIDGFQEAVKEKGAVTATADAVASVATFLGNARNAFRENRDAPLRAVQQIASQIPGVVGAVARAVGAIDSLVGGRLLGTNNQLTGSSTNVNIGQNGASGSQTQNFERQRSFFRGTARSSQSQGLDQEALAAFQEIVSATNAAVTAAAVALGQSVPETIASTFRQTFDKDGKLTSSISEILGEKFNESAADFAKRNLAEGLLGVTEQLAPGIRALSEAVRGNATELLDFAQGALAITAAVRDGKGILGPDASAVETTAFTQTQQRAGESLADTYERIAGATATLDAALIISGVTLNKTRQELIVFASAIADEAGGLQNAASLWTTYFETFYTDEERALKAVEQANAARASALASVGLEVTATAAQFRAQFEAALPTLSPEQIVTYLRAGEAIATAEQAQDGYNRALADAREEAEEAARALADLASSLADIEASISDGFTELERSGLSPFQRSILEINDNLRNTTTSLNSQRAAAARAGAASDVLAQYDLALGRAHLLAAAQAAAAIAKLRSAARSLIDRLYGGGQAEEFGSNGQDAFERIGEAANDMYESQLNSIKTIQEYLDSQLLGSNTSLTPFEQFEEAQRQFNAAIASGNAQESTRLADILLRLGRERFASSEPFTDLEATVRAALRGLLESFGTPTPGGGFGGGGGGGGSPEEFDAAARENRLALALELGEIVRELLLATGGSLAEVAASIGLNMTKLVTDLGVNLSELSVGTASSLATIANSLGIELSELAQNVSVDLGALSTDQSLINAALEAEIRKLPADQAGRLQPLLDAVEQAALSGGPEKINAAILALEAETRAIGGETANRLAPFLDGIDPTDPLRGIDSAIRSGFSAANLSLSSISASLARTAAAAAANPPRPPTGSPPVPPPGPTGTPTAVSGGSFIFSSPTPGRQQASSAPANFAAPIVAELKRTNARLEMLEATTRAGTTQTVRATTSAGETIATAAKQKPEAKSRLVMSE